MHDMRITKLKLQQIHYNYTSYEQILYDSILRVGFQFPVKIEIKKDNDYYCVDGHKRLSALEDILKDYPDYKRKDDVNVIIVNNGNNRSNDCWRGRNHH